MKHKSLTQYFRENLDRGIIDFHVRAEKHHKSGDIHFYIHPAAVSGDTEDFMATEDPDNWDFDMLMNLRNLPTDAEIEAGAKRLIESLRASRSNQ